MLGHEEQPSSNKFLQLNHSPTTGVYVAGAIFYPTLLSNILEHFPQANFHANSWVVYSFLHQFCQQLGAINIHLFVTIIINKSYSI
jgi:hypothetical protein